MCPVQEYRRLTLAAVSNQLGVIKNHSLTKSYSGDSITNIQIDKMRFDKGNEVLDSVFENNRLTRIIKQEFEYY